MACRTCAPTYEHPAPSNRQFFVGTEVEFLPLSFVRDTCGVTVDRKDDVHSKQRLGDLPKPLRCVEKQSMLTEQHSSWVVCWLWGNSVVD